MERPMDTLRALVILITCVGCLGAQPLDLSHELAVARELEIETAALAQDSLDLLRMTRELTSEGTVHSIEISAVGALVELHARAAELSRVATRLGVFEEPEVTVDGHGPIVTRVQLEPLPERRFKDLYWRLLSQSNRVRRYLDFAWSLPEVRDRYFESVRPRIDRIGGRLDVLDDLSAKRAALVAHAPLVTRGPLR